MFARKSNAKSRLGKRVHRASKAGTVFQRLMQRGFQIRCNQRMVTRSTRPGKSFAVEKLALKLCLSFLLNELSLG